MSAVGVYRGTLWTPQKVSQLWTLIVVFLPTMTGYTWERLSTEPSDVDGRNVVPVPSFDDYMTSRGVEATIGQTVLLPCTVRNLRDKVVSWIRSRDLHILTSAGFAFSSDNRFEAVHPVTSDFWGLRIRGVAITDTGQYECQINTDPKMSFALNLTVIIPGVQELESSNSKWVSRALIKGPREVYVRDGSPVTFTCEISPMSVANVQSLASPAYGPFVFTHSPVRWLHDDIELQAGSQNVTISSTNETTLRTTSILKISTANSRHSGRYTCMQPSSVPDTTRLFVIKEHTEAMQRDSPMISATLQHSTNSSMRSVVYILISIFLQRLLCT